MQVAVVALNKGRGSGVVARQHIRALRARGHAVVSVHAYEPKRMAGIEHREVVPASGILPVHEYLPGHAGPQLPVSEMSEAAAAALIDDFEAVVDGIEPGVDVIVAHHANASTVAAARVARRRGIPYVVFTHGTGVEPRHLGGYPDAIWEQIAEAVAGAEGIIVTTEYVRDALVRRIVDVPLDRFFVLPCGIDLQEFRPTTKQAMRTKYGLPDRYVICPGALTEVKGPQNVVAASAQYSDLAPTVFIGDGALRDELEDRLAGNGRFFGYVSEQDKAGLINEATILTAAPNKREHFGIIYAEALAAGTVPVAYGGGGVDSIIRPHVGVLTERNPLALGGAIRTRLENPLRTRLMAIQARRRATTHFDNEVLSRRFADWLEGATGIAPPVARDIRAS
jgi:glycosyltransferase involved in cell wall biosynthesis